MVEDDPGLRESTAAILRNRGFDVEVAADGAAATWQLANGEFDVVVLDLHLCHVDGTAVLDSLEPSASVVVVSAFADVDESDIRDEFGPMVYDCLRKPVPPQHLIAVVTAAAAASRRSGRRARVQPIEPRDALRLAMAGLAHLVPPGPAD